MANIHTISTCIQCVSVHSDRTSKTNRIRQIHKVQLTVSKFHDLHNILPGTLHYNDHNFPGLGRFGNCNSCIHFRTFQTLYDTMFRNLVDIINRAQMESKEQKCDSNESVKPKNTRNTVLQSAHHQQPQLLLLLLLLLLQLLITWLEVLQKQFLESAHH